MKWEGKLSIKISHIVLVHGAIFVCCFWSTCSVHFKILNETFASLNYIVNLTSKKPSLFCPQTYGLLYVQFEASPHTAIILQCMFCRFFTKLSPKKCERQSQVLHNLPILWGEYGNKNRKIKYECRTINRGLLRGLAFSTIGQCVSACFHSILLSDVEEQICIIFLREVIFAS